MTESVDHSVWANIMTERVEERNGNVLYGDKEMTKLEKQARDTLGITQGKKIRASDVHMAHRYNMNNSENTYKADIGKWDNARDALLQILWQVKTTEEGSQWEPPEVPKVTTESEEEVVIPVLRRRSDCDEDCDECCENNCKPNAANCCPNAGCCCLIRTVLFPVGLLVCCIKACIPCGKRNQDCE